MDIEALIRSEAPEAENSIHDSSYAKALKKAHEFYAGKGRDELIGLQRVAREEYRNRGSHHSTVAACVVLAELLKETKG